MEHAYAKGKPLSSQKGQAEAFFLVDDAGNGWILKKFRQTCRLDASYLVEVAFVLPREKAFVCGTNRLILNANSLQKEKGCHYNKDLDQWLEGTVLMPRVKGADWACLADGIRDGEVVLAPERRLNLCRNLTRLVERLEAYRCSHRDLSCGNVFIDVRTGEVYLIDFDSLFHPHLVMPRATTCGTEGYTPSYAWINGRLDPRSSWCERADRYALALLNAEMLLVDKATAATGEGGIFNQEELKNGSGRGIDSIVAELRCQYPGAGELLLRAIRSHNAAECPSPDAWGGCFGSMPSDTSSVPALSELPDLTGRITDILARSRPAAPMWPAPNLSEVPAAVPRIPARRIPVSLNVTLPSDAWATPDAFMGRATP
jgi:hypothetical protein